jgi:hypothetical protein
MGYNRFLSPSAPFQRHTPFLRPSILLESVLIRPSFFLSAGVLSALLSVPSHLTAQTIPVGYEYTPLDTPCRAVDTRITGGAVAAGTSQSFDPSGGDCKGSINAPFPQGVPVAWAMNVTVVPHGPLGYLSIWPTGEPQPIVSTLNSLDGRIKANAAIVKGGNGGQVSVYVTDLTDVILDITGFFAPTGLGGEQEVYVPHTPCRFVDTRLNMPLIANQASSFGGDGTCFSSGPGMPYTGTGPYASASLNVTVVPQANHPVGYVTVWESGDSFDVPLVSNVNVPTGAVVANATIASGANQAGHINAYASDNTDLVIDVTGSFNNQQTTVGGLSFYPVSPCRVLDTRETGGAFQGPLAVSFTNSPCKLPPAEAYVVNATVVPDPILNYLTLWPDDGSSQPLVSTLNASDGSITSNMAIVGTANGSINTYATNPTNLILDVAGYFAPLQDTSGLKVAFMGDDSTQTAIAAVQAQHPNWINAGGSVGETTDKMVARFQTDVLDKHPDVVVIMAGQYDLVQPGYDLSRYGGCGGTNDTMCANVSKMFDMAYQAGVKYLIHPLLNCSANCQSMAGANQEAVSIAMITYNRLLVIGEGQGDPPHPVVLFSDLVGGTIAILDGFTASSTDPAAVHAMARKARAAR